MAILRDFLHPLFGNFIFKASMSRVQFEELLLGFRFDNTGTRSEQKTKDKFAPLSDLGEIINTNLLKHYVPGENLTIDEQLVPFRGRVAFKQYIPPNPDKFGIKIWCIWDSKNSYPLKGIPYLGKKRPVKAINLASIFVEELCIPFHHSNIFLFIR